MDDLLLSFQSEDPVHGMSQTNGLLRFERDTLVFEFQNVTLGLIKSRAKETHVPLRAVAAIDLKTNLFQTKLLLRVSRLGVLDGLPHNGKGELKLSLKRKDRKEAAAFISAVRLRQSELKLEESEAKYEGE